jgi:hypothetical protein
MIARRFKVYRLAPEVVLRAVDETSCGGAARVRLEGRVFGATASAVKHFPDAAAAAAFFAAYSEVVAEEWWRSLQDRVAEEFAGYMLRGMGGAKPVGLLHA